MGQVAHAKVRGALFDPITLTEEEAQVHLGASFWDYDQKVREYNPKRLKIDFGKNYVPPIGTAFWKAIFSYMMNKEKAFVDLEFYLCFENPYCIKDFWNTSESSLGKATRRLALLKVGLSRRIFIPTNMLHNSTEKVRPYHFPRFLKNREEIFHFENDEFIHSDIFYDTEEYDRIGIRVISSTAFDLKTPIQRFAKAHKLNLTTWWKKRPTKMPQKQVIPNNTPSKNVTIQIEIKKEVQVTEIKQRVRKRSRIRNFFAGFFSSSKINKNEPKVQEKQEKEIIKNAENNNKNLGDIQILKTEDSKNQQNIQILDQDSPLITNFDDNQNSLSILP